MWLIALILFWGVLLLTVTTLQRSRGEAVLAAGKCPNCSATLQRLSPTPDVQPPRSWEVLACPACDVAAPSVQGIAGRAGWCPHCKQRALELSVARLDVKFPGDIRVQVTEHCHLCEHEDELIVQHQTAPSRGKVIPFPGDRD